MGKSSAIVESIEDNKIVCKVRCNSNIYDKCIVHMYLLFIYRINNDTNEAVEITSKKSIEEYIEDLNFSIELDTEFLLVNGLDGIEGIKEIKKEIAERKSKIKLLAKLDNKWSVTEIDSYISVCFSIL